jgi:8-oxo-dGTP pyrophosphatase MutT (NUDIX family)
VVDGDRVLLLFHRKLRMWLPPGGHIDRDELPDEAAVREVLEETGIRVALVGESGLPVEYPRQLVRPEGIQLERISPDHEHVDLIYFAVPTGGKLTESVECDRAGWYTLDELARMGVSDEVRAWSARAVRAVADRLVARR